MADDSGGTSKEPALTRRQLELVIRRAAEISAAEADADERLSEDEVLRIGAELGLPARSVRQALFELPTERRPAGLMGGLFGPVALEVARTLRGDASANSRRLEDYLVTREYLQVRRRKGEHAWLEPADDAISSVARALTRPSSRYNLARASRVITAVRPLEAGWTHVRLDVELGERRTSAVRRGFLLGALFGAALGGGMAATVVVLAGLPAAPIAVAGAALAGVTGFTGGLAGGVALAASRFRRRLVSTRLELEGLLDRLQHGGPLDPPPSPFLRRLRLRFGGGRSIFG